MTTRRLWIILSLWMLLSLPVPASVVSYFRFEGNAQDETGLMNGEPLNFDEGVDYEGWSSDVFAPTVPLTGQQNTGSLRFAGGSEFVDLSNGTALSLGMSFTIEFFMKLTDPNHVSVAYGFSPISGLSLLFDRDGDGFYKYQVELMGQRFYDLATDVTFDSWQHFAFIKTPGEYSLYLDGLLMDNASVPSSVDGPYWFPGTDNTGDRTIGGQYGTFRGWLDEFRISDTALTPDQFLCAIPEPATLALLLVGIPALGFARHRNRVRK